MIRSGSGVMIAAEPGPLGADCLVVTSGHTLSRRAPTDEVYVLLGRQAAAVKARAEVIQLPLLDVEEGYWERAGLLRSLVLQRGRRAPLADALIAQSCLDHNAPLVTRDADFSGFARLAGLRLFGS